ncbi:MAG TPA: hypothetical protein VM939_10565, partial [Gemmatimonadaceae bacterium]|nr:hypothetical protein [Gemmatimonadaceae bacterium]
VRARLLERASGKVLRAFTPARVSLSDPAAGLESLRSRVRGALGVILHRMLGLGALPGNDAPNHESFAEFGSALVDMERALSGLTMDRDKTMRHLQRASELDSSFMQPLIWQARIVQAGFAGRRAADSALTALLVNRGERLTAYERSLVELFQASLRGDAASSARTSERLYRITPVEWTVQAYARALMQLARYKPALALFDSLSKTATEDDPEFWSNYVRTLHLSGDHARELVVARRAVALMPERRGVRNFEIVALVANDSTEAAMRAIDNVMTLPDEMDAANSRFGVYAAGVAESRAHGNEEFASVLERKALPAMLAAADEEDSVAVLTALVGNLVTLRQDNAALALARRLVVRDSVNFALAASAGIAAAFAGDTAFAIRQMRKIEAIGSANRPYTQGGDFAARSRIAAALGRDTEALALGARAIAQGQGFTYRRGAHFGREFRRLQANPEFQKLLRPRDD